MCGQPLKYNLPILYSHTHPSLSLGLYTSSRFRPPYLKILDPPLYIAQETNKENLCFMAMYRVKRESLIPYHPEIIVHVNISCYISMEREFKCLIMPKLSNNFLQRFKYECLPASIFYDQKSIAYWQVFSMIKSRLTVCPPVISTKDY